MTNFPSSLDSLTNPTSGNSLDTAGVLHDVEHSDANDILEALEAKVGIDSSAVTTSHDYRLATLDSGPLFKSRSYFFDEFENVQGTGTGVARLDSHFLTSGTGTIEPDSSTVTASHPGVIEMRTDAGRTTIYGSVNTSSVIVGAYVLGGGKLRCGVWLKTPSALSDGTNDYRILAGLGLGGTSLDPTDGVYLLYNDDANSGKWDGVCRASSTSSLAGGAGSAVTASTWYLLEAEVNAAGTSVTFYVDGSQIGSAVTTNIPSAALSPRVTIRQTAGGTSRSMYVDAYYLYAELTTPR